MFANTNQRLSLPYYWGKGINQVTEAALGAPAVPPDILQLSSTFPVPWQMDMNVRQRIRDLLPARPDCQLICEQARQNALWQYVYFAEVHHMRFT